MRFDELRDAACEIATSAGALIRDAHARSKSHDVETKSAVIDLVTATDRASEKLIADALAERYPAHGLIGEEGTHREGSPTWIVDPLDGTTNFAHGIPIFGVSMAAELEGEIVVGVVYDVMREELFAASRGSGATLNGLPIEVSTRARLADAVACSGFPYDRRDRADFYLSYWRTVMVNTQGVRRTGAAAIDLAWVAAGRYDAFWEFGLARWDVAAGALLIEEAGGQVDLEPNRITATNGHLHQEFIDLIP